MVALHRVHRGVLIAAALASLAPAALGAWRLEDRKPLTRGGEAIAPVLAPDGDRVAYLVGQRSPALLGQRSPSEGATPGIRGRLWMLNRKAADAALMGRFTVEAVEGECLVAFAPSGSAYAYVEGRRAEPTLWYVDADGDRLRVGSGRAASFGPQGDLLAYTVWDTGEKPAVELWLFEMERRESKRLARVAVGTEIDLTRPAAAPRWSADGTRLIFAAGGDLYGYGRFTGRIDGLTRTGDISDFDVAPNGAVWYLRNGRDRDAAGIWNLRADARATMRAFRADELPSGIAGLAAGPDADTVLFIADTAAGRGLVAADARDGRWRYVAAAAAFSLRPRGQDVALEVAGDDGKRNIYMGRLVSESSRSGR